jgi:hypothetical protein
MLNSSCNGILTLSVWEVIRFRGVHKGRATIMGLVSFSGLITREYRELKNLNSPNINDPKKEWANELNRVFSEEEVQIAKNT